MELYLITRKFCKEFFSNNLQFSCEQEALRHATPLDDIPPEQAMSVMVLKSNFTMKSATIAFRGDTLMTMQDPTAFEVTALLLGSYFVFCQNYPQPYLWFLSVIEKILHGEVDKPKKRRGPVLDFLTELYRAKQKLLAMLCK